MKTKSATIRSMLKAGKTVKEITKAVKVSPQVVYTQKWMMKGGEKKVAARKMILQFKEANKKATPNADFVREELANVERQIDNLNVIASFLAIRLRQLEQNGE